MPMFLGYWFNFRQASIESIRIRKLVFSFYCIFVKKNHSTAYPCSVNNANNCLHTCRTNLVLVIFTIWFEWSRIFWPWMWIFLTNSGFFNTIMSVVLCCCLCFVMYLQIIFVVLNTKIQFYWNIFSIWFIDSFSYLVDDSLEVFFSWIYRYHDNTINKTKIYSCFSFSNCLENYPISIIA